MNLGAAAILASALLAFLSNPASAEKRVALVIGNGAYQHTPKLTNPTRDASAVAEMFRKAGFEAVLAHNDLGHLGFKRSLRDFLEVVQNSDIAVLFYAGHGVQIGDQNYMLPIDARLEREYDAKDELVSLERMVEALEPAKRLRLVILDACRDNPFLARMQPRVAARGILTRGLARVEPTQVDTLIAYAAKAGASASDGEDGHSPFTKALLKHIAEPGLDIRLAFGRVRDEVLKNTRSEQEPFVYGSLGGSNMSLVPPPAIPKEAPLADLAADYNLVEKINSKMAYEVFINTHKTGILVDVARKRLQILEDQERGGVTATPKIAGLPPPQEQGNPSAEQIKAWNRVKDSADRVAIRKFIESNRSSPLVDKAREVLDELERVAREEERRAIVEREAARQREDEARRAKAHADRQRAEREAALAKAAREEAERKRVERQREAEAEAEHKRQAEADRQKAEREAALVKAAREKAEADRKKADREAALAKAAEAEAERKRQSEAGSQKAEREAAVAKAAREKAEADQQKAEREAALAKAAEAEAQRKRQAEADRQKAERDAAHAKTAREEAERKRQAEACGREEKSLDRLKTDISQASAREELNRLERAMTCEQLRSAVTALQVEAQRLKEVQALAAIQVSAAQQELRRIGCYSGRNDGALQQATKDAIRRYHAKRGRPTTEVNVTEDLVNELKRAPPNQCVEVARPEKGKQIARPPQREREEPRKHTAVRPPAPTSRVMTGVGF